MGMNSCPNPWRQKVIASGSAVVGVLAAGLLFFVQPNTATVTPISSGADTPIESLSENLASRQAAVDVIVIQALAETPVEPAVSTGAALVALEQSAVNPCGDALDWVAASGLELPVGVGFYCPSTQFSHHGAACWNAGPCPGGAFVAINTDLFAGSGTEYLRHVVAHEVCHILDWQSVGTTSEAGADSCAAAHSAPA